MKRNSWNSSTVREQEELLISPRETAKLTSSDRLFLRRHLIPPCTRCLTKVLVGWKILVILRSEMVWWIPTRGIVIGKDHDHNDLHPWSSTWNLKINPWKRRFLLETIIFRFHVKNFGRGHDLSQCHGLHHFPASRMPCSTSCCTSNSLRSPSSFVSNISNLSWFGSKLATVRHKSAESPKAKIPQSKAENRKPKAENPTPKAKRPDTRREHGQRMIRSYSNPTSPPWWMSTELRTHSSPVDERWKTHAWQSQAQKADYPNLKAGSRKPEAESRKPTANT